MNSARLRLAARLAPLGLRALLAALLLVPGTAVAQDAKRVRLDVTVVHLSDADGGIDAAARRLDSKLRERFRYRSLRVLQTKSLSLALDELATVSLPNGRRFRVRPLNVGEHGLLVAVDFEGTLQSDMRVSPGHLVVLGPQAYQGGELVVSLEAQF